MKPRTTGKPGRYNGWYKALSLFLILALVPACQPVPAKIYIPLAYGVTGLCIALLISPSITAAIVGLVTGVILGAAVYNNSLKGQLARQ